MMAKTLLISCVTRHFYPETAENIRKLCQSAGIECLESGTLTCCGLPYFEKGELNTAKKTGEYNLSVIGQNKLLCTSPKCYSVYAHHYPRIFNNTVSHNAAVALAKNTGNLAEVAKGIPASRLDTVKGHYFLVKECCSEQPSLPLEQMLKNCTWSYPSLRNGCCGAGASMPAMNRELARQLSVHILEEFKASGAEYIVCEDDICRKQLENCASESGISAPTLNIVDLLPC